MTKTVSKITKGTDYVEYYGFNMPLKEVVMYQQTGSSYICHPSVMNTDRDVLVLDKQNRIDLFNTILYGGEKDE